MCTLTFHYRRVLPLTSCAASYDARLVDVWACGIVFYCLHFQELPWGVAQLSDSLYATYVTECTSAEHSIVANAAGPAPPPREERAKEKEKDKTSVYPTTIQNLSPRACRPILRRILEPDPDHRVLVEDILKDPWIVSIEVCTDPNIPHTHTHPLAVQTAQQQLPQ